jgi:hypothetical protein
LDARLRLGQSRERIGRPCHAVAGLNLAAPNRTQ